MPEKETRDEGHAVREVQSHDCEVEDRIDGDCVDKHEEPLSQGTDSYETNRTGGSFVGREHTEEAAPWEAAICPKDQSGSQQKLKGG